MSSYLAAWTVLPQDFGYETAQTQKGKQVKNDGIIKKVFQILIGDEFFILR